MMFMGLGSGISEYDFRGRIPRSACGGRAIRGCSLFEARPLGRPLLSLTQG